MPSTPNSTESGDLFATADADARSGNRNHAADSSPGGDGATGGTRGEKQAGPTPVITIKEGYLYDYITGKPKKETKKELVRQKTARALVHELGIHPANMKADFRVKVDVNGKTQTKRADIAIWDPEDEGTLENVKRVVVCKPEPKKPKKGGQKIRDYDQAKKDLQDLEGLMAALPECTYGLWTNGLDLFYLKKEETRFDVSFQPIGDWPPADESLGTRDVLSNARMRTADPEMLKTTFRRCHNFIHGNEGMQKDKAFFQFLYLIFAKMYDERHNRNGNRQFWAGPTERFRQEGWTAVRGRIEPLFEQAKEKYKDVFRGNEEVELSDRALAFMVSELQKYDFTRTELDAKGAAYQEIVGDNLRGDRGQYFTPRSVIDMAVAMLDPQPDERVLDPACGTGGFLVSTLAHIMGQLRDEQGVDPHDETSSEFLAVKEELARYAETNLFGADFDRELVKATTMNIAMATGKTGNVFHMDSLAFPKGHLEGAEKAAERIPLDSVDVVLTNPPFGSDIPISDRAILEPYKLALKWDRGEDGVYRPGDLQNSVAPEVLFIEQAIKWLRPGGRMAIVLPNGILGNPGDEPIRKWILEQCWVLASVEVPIEAFIVEANVNILTSVVFLKRKTVQEMDAEALGGTMEYPVFMAVAETCGFDRRGNTLYQRSPEGEEIAKEVEKIETIRIDGQQVQRNLKRLEKIIDNDLPEVAKAYRAFRTDNPEPGA